jgi:hypothetical protein
MPYVHYASTRERPSYSGDSDSHFSRPALIRRNSKRQRVDFYDDDKYDDYPPYVQPTDNSRALTVRGPSEPKKYNVYNDDANDSSDNRDYKITHKHYNPRPERSDDESDRDEFRLKFKATFSRPKSRSSEKAAAWPVEMYKLKSRERWEGYEGEWNEREREQRNSFWDDEEPTVRESHVRIRKIKRTKTEEWRPLSGWKRY